MNIYKIYDRKLTDNREIHFAVSGGGLLEIDPASVNGGVALTDFLENEFRGVFWISEEGTIFEADILPVFPLFEVASTPRVETVNKWTYTVSDYKNGKGVGS